MKSQEIVAFVFAFEEGEPERFFLPVLGIPTFERTIRALRGAGIKRIFVFADIPRVNDAAGEGAIEALDPENGDLKRAIRKRTVLGTAGDLPLLTPGSVRAFIERFDPSEGLLVCEGAPLFLARGESPLFDAVAAALNGPSFGFESVAERYEAAGGKVKTVSFLPSDEALRPSRPCDLPKIAAIARRRRIDSLLEGGVSIIDPERTYVDEDVSVEAGTVLLPGVHLRGVTRIGPACTVGPDSFIEDSIVEEGSAVRYSVLEGSRVRQGSSIGPYAHLRPGSDVGPEARVGNFVEVKAARLGRGVKAGHLSYIGDAEVGEGTNIGAGTVTCNYDGVKKNRTVIAGSTITDDVPPNRLAFGRARQVVKEKKEEGSDRQEA